MRTLFISFLIIFSLQAALSQSRIKVFMPGAEHKTAFVWTYTDYISYTKKVIGYFPVSAKGSIDFKVYAGNLMPVYVQIDFVRINFFIEPGKNYEIRIEKTDYSKPELFPKSSIGYLSPVFRIVKPEKQDFNKGMKHAAKLFAEFVDSNYLALVRGLNTKFLVDSFANVIETYADSFDNKNLDDYIGFQMAELRLLNHDYSEAMVVKQFFDSKKMNLHNPFVMRYFNSFWSNYLVMKGKGYSPFQLDSVINREQSYAALSALLENDPLLKDDTLRELVIIRNIPQMYANRRFDRKALADILSDISASKLRKEHQFIATNVRKEMLQRQAGSPAPEFGFIDLAGDSIDLKKYEGMYVYLNIWDTECPECLAEMEYEKELYEDFDDIIAFVSISVDADTAFMRQYVKSREFKWQFAHIDTQLKFLYDYRVDVLPRYILINKEGKIEWWNAPAPSKHFQDMFLKMLNDKKGNLNLEQR